MSLKSKIAENKASQPTIPPDVIVAALAGTGKTTTLVEGLKILLGQQSKLTPSPQQQAVWDAIALSKGLASSICFVAFNKAIAAELQRRVPAGVSAMTMHSMGLKAVTAAFGRVKIENWRVPNLIAEITGKDLRDLRKKDFELVNGTERLVQLCKMNLIGGSDQGITTDELDRLASHYEVELNGSRSEVYDLVPKVLAKCLDVNHDGMIDFNDMIWLPVAHKLAVTRYDLLLVDECQDLNRCQQQLAKMAGKRLILCGDTHQAIYGFAGADAESMSRMEEELTDGRNGCMVLPLTVTRRCGKAIVREAQAIVPAFEAHKSNGEGTIKHARFKASETALSGGEGCDPSNASYRNIVQEGDMCLCRVNAPLVGQCLRFIKEGRRAEIQGRDIGQGLISTVKKQKVDTVLDLVEKLSDWLHAETEKENRKRMPNENKIISLQDRYDCLICFCDGVKTVEEVINKIERVFTDDENTLAIRFSSIHKAKGLEARRVFLLEPEGATVPHPMAKSAWQKAQEYNLRYVAITRAIEELVYVK